MITSKPEDYTKEIHINENEYLTVALKNAGYENIPSNVILDKTLTGIGATYTEIEAKRNSIIIEPNVPVIIGKTNNRSNLLGVYEKCTQTAITKYFQSDIPFKKFITTPESFWKIKKVANELDINIHKDYFCLFDECEKIMQDVEFRENITQPIVDFFQFDNKAFVSATPLIIKHLELELQKFERWKIIPDYDYNIDIEIIGTDKFNITVLEKLQSLQDSRCICVFFNSVTGINKIVASLNETTEDYKIFCSEKSKKGLKELGFKNTYEDLHLPLAKYNFFTCRFFSAVDIELPYNPDIIILTDLQTAKHSMVDPLSEVIQIQGRFKEKHDGKKYNSITHITNFLNMDALTEEQVKKEFNEWKISYMSLIDRYKSSTDTIVRNAIEKEIIKGSIFPYLNNPDYTVNDFAVVNKYNEERVKGYYSHEDKLLIAYSSSGCFNSPRYIDNIDRTFHLEYEVDLNLKGKKSRSEKEQIRLFVNYLNTCENILELRNQFNGSLKNVEQNEINCTLIDAYLKFGALYFNQNKTFKTIKKELDTAVKFEESQEKRFCKEFIQVIIEEFDPYIDKQINQNEVKSKLQIIFNRYNITKENGNNHTVTKVTIKDYFTVKTNNDKQTYTFVAVLPEILTKIQSDKQ